MGVRKKKPKHTPGPWAIDPDHDDNNVDGFGVAIYRNPSKEPYGVSFDKKIATTSAVEDDCADDEGSEGYEAAWEEVCANARLIAAAPDLLAACEAMLSAHGNCGSPVEQRAANLCEAAIERATGARS